MSTMSDFESEEMGWRYWVDAVTTSTTDHREGGETKNICPGNICVVQYSEVNWYVHAPGYVDCLS